MNRLDYSIHNFCNTCKIKYDKTVHRCTECKMITRKMPRSRRSKAWIERQAVRN